MKLYENLCLSYVEIGQILLVNSSDRNLNQITDLRASMILYILAVFSI